MSIGATEATSCERCGRDISRDRILCLWCERDSERARAQAYERRDQMFGTRCPDCVGLRSRQEAALKALRERVRLWEQGYIEDPDEYRQGYQVARAIEAIVKEALCESEVACDEDNVPKEDVDLADGIWAELHETIDEIAREAPELADHLRRSLKKEGDLFRYCPDPDDPIRVVIDEESRQIRFYLGSSSRISRGAIKKLVEES